MKEYLLQGEWTGVYEYWDEWGSSESRGGLALKNLHHQYFRLAKDIRPLGIWVFPKDTKTYKPKFLLLGPPDFERVGSGSPLVTGTIERAPDRFQDYHTIQELKITWESFEPLFGIDGKKLKVTQKYLFTDYGIEPPHEPSALIPYSAGLPATRLFPLVEFEYENDGRLASLRVDYRFHLNLDGTLEQNYTLARKIVPNQMGVFKDADILTDAMFGPIEQMGTEATEGLDGDYYFMQGALDSIEKPSYYEIASLGLVKGSPKAFVKQHLTSNGLTEYLPCDENDLDAKEIRCWDNLHWWGSRGARKPIISAIGAFHCFHFHWRWGVGAQLLTQPFSFTEYELIYEPFQEESLRTVKGFEKLARKKLGELWDAEYEKFIDFSDLGGLTDSRIPSQTHRFAITKYSENTDPIAMKNGSWVLNSVRSLTTEDFFDFFMRDSADNFTQPKNVNLEETEGYLGTDMVLWYSIEAHLEENTESTIAGTFLIQGMYFAHDPEPVLFDPTFELNPYVIPYPEQWYRLVSVDIVKQTHLLRGSQESEYKPWDENKVSTNQKWFRAPDLYI
jgi:hypothetical protein